MRHRNRLFFALFLLSLWPLVAAQCNEDQDERARRILEGGMTEQSEPQLLARIAALEANLGGLHPSTTLQQRMVQLGVPGLTVAVIHNGAVEWVEAYGVKDPASGSPVLRSTLFQGGSLSKPVTAVALMKLVEQGAIGLDDPVNQSLTTWQIPDNPFTVSTPVTLRHLLSHSAGVNLPSFLGYNTTAGVQVPTLLEVLDGVAPAQTPPIRVIQEPTRGWQYSGGGYTILQQLLEDVTGESFPLWQKQNLFLPLAMHGSLFDQPLPAEQLPSAARGQVGGTTLAEPFVYPQLPAAGLWSRSLDLGRFVVAMQKSLAGESGAILGANTAADIFTAQIPGPQPGQLVGSAPRMGLGFFLVDGPFPDWFWHTGGNVGYTCILVGDLQGAGYGAVVMTNSSSGGQAMAWEIVNGIADLYAWPGWNDWGL